MKRFSEHVVDCIRRGDYAIADNFTGMGTRYVVNKQRMDDSEYKHIGWPAPLRELDDWDLGLSSWLFGLCPLVHLTRGPDHFKVKLTKQEHSGLASNRSCYIC